MRKIIVFVLFVLVSLSAVSVASAQTSYPPLMQGTTNALVGWVQEKLIGAGFIALDAPTNFFGPVTARGVSLFQEENASAVLAPLGLTRGTGYMGALTWSEFVNQYGAPPATMLLSASARPSYLSRYRNFPGYSTIYSSVAGGCSSDNIADYASITNLAGCLRRNGADAEVVTFVSRAGSLGATPRDLATSFGTVTNMVSVLSGLPNLQAATNFVSSAQTAGATYTQVATGGNLGSFVATASTTANLDGVSGVINTAVAMGASYDEMIGASTTAEMIAAAGTDPEELQAVLEKLKEMNVDYEQILNSYKNMGDLAKDVNRYGGGGSGGSGGSGGGGGGGSGGSGGGDKLSGILGKAIEAGTNPKELISKFGSLKSAFSALSAGDISGGIDQIVNGILGNFGGKVGTITPCTCMLPFALVKISGYGGPLMWSPESLTFAPPVPGTQVIGTAKGKLPCLVAIPVPPYCIPVGVGNIVITISAGGK